MSIEPTIANKSVYQDSESRPRDTMRNFFAGGDTRQDKFNSYWDDAVSASENAEEKGEAADTKRVATSAKEQYTADTSSNVLGFSRTQAMSGGGFSFSPMAFGREQIGNIVDFGRIEMAVETEPKVSSGSRMENTKHADRGNESKRQTAENDLEDDDESKRAEGRNAANVAASRAMAPLAQSRRLDTSNAGQDASTNTQAPQNSEASNGLQLTESQKPTSEVMSAPVPVAPIEAKPAPAPAPETAQVNQPVQTPVSAAVVAESNAAKAPSETAAQNQAIQPDLKQASANIANAATTGAQQTHAPLENQPLNKDALSTPVPVNDDAKAEKPVQVPVAPVDATKTAKNTEGQKIVETPLKQAVENADEKLAIDPEKATSELSAALKKTQAQGLVVKADAKQQLATDAKVVSVSDTAQTQSTELTATENKQNTNRISEAATTAAQTQKGLDAIDGKAVAGNARAGQDASDAKAVLNRQASANEVTAGVEASAKEAASPKTNDQIQQARAAVAARTVRAPVQVSNAGNAQAKVVGLNGVTSTGAASGTTGVPGGPSVQQSANPQSQSQQQSSGKGDGAKQEFSDSLKGAMTSGKGAEKSSSEGTQSFGVGETSSSTSARRSEAAAKAQGTSYASKTAEEVKEIYSALSRGVERMLNTKQDSMNVRINFDQGGSISMKLSVENGQINTAMSTDLAGLEEVIKAGWGDLSSEWNQKGLKLNAPQFSGGAQAGKENLADSFDQSSKGQQQSQESTQQGNGSGNQRNSGANQGNRSSFSRNANRETSANDASRTESNSESSNESELNSYA